MYVCVYVFMEARGAPRAAARARRTVDPRAKSPQACSFSVITIYIYIYIIYIEREMIHIYIYIYTHTHTHPYMIIVITIMINIIVDPRLSGAFPLDLKNPRTENLRV